MCMREITGVRCKSAETTRADAMEPTFVVIGVLYFHATAPFACEVEHKRLVDV